MLFTCWLHVSYIRISDECLVFQMLLNEKAAALQEEVDDLLMVPLDLPAPLKTQQLT